MPRNILQDIKPISREGRRTAPVMPPESVSTAPREQAAPMPPQSQTPPQSRPYVPPASSPKPLPREVPYVPRTPKTGSRYGLWYIAVACVVGLLFALSFLFEESTVIITPKSVPVAFDMQDTFTALKDSNDSTAIIYTVMSLSGDETVRLPSTESKNVDQPAKGTVTLSNEYSTKPYALVKSTRLQAPNGKIYRLDAGATIPGYKTEAGKIVPGTVDVAVTAAEAGEVGNIETAKFTIPGLAGTVQAAKITGQTKTAISGGASGKMYTIPQESADAAMGTLAEKLKTTLLSKAKVQIPDGYVFFEGATILDLDDTVQVPYSKEEEVPIVLRGTLTAYLIKEDTLTKAIARRFASQYDGEPVMIPGIAELILEPATSLDPQGDVSFTFSLTGTKSIVWDINKLEIQESLAARKKSEFEKILASVTGVERAEVILRPFWKRSFPEDPNRIEIQVSEPAQ